MQTRKLLARIMATIVLLTDARGAPYIMTPRRSQDYVKASYRFSGVVVGTPIFFFN